MSRSNGTVFYHERTFYSDRFFRGEIRMGPRGLMWLMEEDVPRPIRSASAARPLAGSCRCVCPVVGSQHQKCRTFTACTAFTPIEDDDEDDYEKGRARSNPLLAPSL